jgi:putative endonuclease
MPCPPRSSYDDQPMREYFVYILASRSKRLYVGVTSNLEQRVAQHKSKAIPGFTSRYNIDRLVWYESTNSAIDAVERERQLKNWRREKKVALIEAENAAWDDLAAV